MFVKEPDASGWVVELMLISKKHCDSTPFTTPFCGTGSVVVVPLQKSCPLTLHFLKPVDIFGGEGFPGGTSILDSGSH